jgi:hypothetical protein
MSDKHLYIPGNYNSPTVDYDFCFQKIIPRYGIESGSPFKITYIDPSYHIEGFYIIRLNNKLREVRIFGKHPNANLNTKELCLPYDIRGVEFLDIEEIKNYIVWMLEQYSLDDCYFKPVRKLIKTETVTKSEFIKFYEKDNKIWMDTH